MIDYLKLALYVLGEFLAWSFVVALAIYVWVVI